MSSLRQHLLRAEHIVPGACLHKMVCVRWIFSPILLSTMLMGCASRAPTPPAPAEFWSPLTALCGRSFGGTLREAPAGDTTFANKQLVMHVQQCTEAEIRIPFHVGSNRSRTWILSRTNDGFRLKHDHRHQDGSADAITQYGGDTRGNHAGVRQRFFADSRTATLIPGAATNVWTVEVQGEKFVYALHREGTDRRFRIEFDLTRPVPTPPPSWGSASTNPARAELDHIFIVVDADTKAKVAALRNAGLVVDTQVTRHQGQGTASVSILFRNAYLELLYVDPAVRVDPEHADGIADFQRAAAWAETGASPFGIGLRNTGGPLTYSVAAKRYSAKWMRPETYIELLKQSNEPLASDVFVVPDYMALPSWIARLAERSPHLLNHPNGAEAITAARIAGPAAYQPRVLQQLAAPNLTFTTSNEVVLTLELDHGRRGDRFDLRPTLPLVIVR